jgi:hypothetical protein
MCVSFFQRSIDAIADVAATTVSVCDGDRRAPERGTAPHQPLGLVDQFWILSRRASACAAVEIPSGVPEPLVACRLGKLGQQPRDHRVKITAHLRRAGMSQAAPARAEPPAALSWGNPSFSWQTKAFRLASRAPKAVASWTSLGSPSVKKVRQVGVRLHVPLVITTGVTIGRTTLGWDADHADHAIIILILGRVGRGPVQCYSHIAPNPYASDPRPVRFDFWPDRPKVFAKHL